MNMLETSIRKRKQEKKNLLAALSINSEKGIASLYRLKYVASLYRLETLELHPIILKDFCLSGEVM